MTTSQQQQRFLGGVEQGFLDVDDTTGPITIGEYDALVRVDTSTGAIGDLTLPSTVPVGTTREHAIVDIGGQGSVNTITILAPGGGSINGAVSLTIDRDFGGVSLSTADGLNYTLVSCCAVPDAFLFSSLGFARGSEGSFLFQAPTTGATPFLSWAAAGVLRYEDRGDGAGPLALLERQSTNLVLDNRTFTPGWNAGTGTLTANDATAPDGPTTAARSVQTLVQYGPYQQISNSALSTLSAWVRASAGAGRALVAYTDGPAVPTAGAVVTTVPSTTWQRPRQSLTPANYYVVVGDGISTIGLTNGVAAGARDAEYDLVQVETGAYPTSAMRTATAAVFTRFADVLWGLVPAWLLTKTIHIPQLSPNFANTELSNGDVRWIFTLDTVSDGLYIDKTGGNVTIKAIESGVVRATSAVLTFAAFAKLGDVVVDPVAAVITVNGVAGAAGTPWNWVGRTNIRIGGIFGGAGNELDGRVASNWTSV